YSTPYAQCHRIAQLLEGQRHLFVLDEFEWVRAPSQPPQAWEYISTLLRAFGNRRLGAHGSFCLVTSRTPVPQLSEGQRDIPVRGLDPEDAVRLLRSTNKVRGGEEELRRVAIGVNGHALMLTLLEGPADQINIAGLRADSSDQVRD